LTTTLRNRVASFSERSSLAASSLERSSALFSWRLSAAAFSPLGCDQGWEPSTSVDVDTPVVDVLCGVVASSSPSAAAASLRTTT